MKQLLLCVIAITAVNSYGTAPNHHKPFLPQEHLTEAQDNCVKVLHLDNAWVNNIMQSSPLPLNNHKFTEFFDCYWKGLGLLSHGHIDYVNYRTLMEFLLQQRHHLDSIGAKETVTRFFGNCEYISNPNPGILAIKMRNCVFEQIEQLPS